MEEKYLPAIHPAGKKYLEYVKTLKHKHQKNK
jgi:hypothetical protein